METNTQVKIVDSNIKSSILKNSKFIFAFSANILTGLAFSAYSLTEVWYVVNKLGLGNLVGVVMMVTAIPGLLFMLLGGIVTDRFSKSKIMVVANGLRVVLIAILLAILQLDLLNLFVLLVFAFLFGTLDAFFWPANASLIPVIVKKEQIGRANAIVRGAYQIAMMLGPVIAAFIIAGFSFKGAFLTIGIFLLLSCVLLLCIKIKVSEVSITENSNIIDQAREGISIVKKSSILLSFIMVLIFTNLFFVGPVGAGTSVVVHDMLHGDATILGFLDSGWAAGLLTGSIIIAILNPRRKRGMLTLILVLLQGLLTIVFSYSTNVLASLLVVYIMGICTSMINIPVFSFVQENTEREKLGRVMSLFTMASNGLLPLSLSIIATALSFGVPISSLLFTSGLILVVFCIYIAITNTELFRID